MKGGFDPQWGYDYSVGNIEVADYAKLPYEVTKGTLTEQINARSNVCYWQASIGHVTVNAPALTQDIKIIQNFPAKYKILEIMVDVTEKWDDGAGPISAVTLSAGWVAAPYSELIQTQDIYTAPVLIGDAAGELNYVAIQNGIRPSWGSTTDIYLRFVAVGGNLSTLTTGELFVYISYAAYE